MKTLNRLSFKNKDRLLQRIKRKLEAAERTGDASVYRAVLIATGMRVVRSMTYDVFPNRKKRDKR